MRPAGMYKVPVFVMGGDLPLDMRFRAVQIERRQELAVGHCFYTVAGAAYADEFFYMGIPWGNVCIPDRPACAIPEPLRGGELKRAPALAGPAPGERFAAYLVAPYPIERFVLYVRMVFIFYEKNAHCLPQTPPLC